MGGHRFGTAAVRTILLFTSLLLSFAATPSLSASLRPIEDFGPNPGRLNMYVYLPEGHQPDSTLVVALHGCTQQASDFDDETGLTAFADRFKFVLLFPEQRQENNAKRCFNWFATEDNQRDGGESASIRNMIRYLVDTHQTDPSKVFVLGLSAGGSMTAVLMANYPALFQGGAIVAGTPYGCNKPNLLNWAWWWFQDLFFGDAAAATVACGLFAYAPTQRSAQAWGDFVRASAGENPPRWPSVSLWQGFSDPIVNPANQRELVKQWTNVLGIDQIPDQVEAFNAVRHSVYDDAAGAPRLETYEIAGFDHAFAIDPGTGPAQCGRTGPYIEDANICGSLKILEFWGVAP